MESMEEMMQKVGETSSGEQPTISLHALLGTNDYHTTRMKGRIKNQGMIMLVDSRSTHTS